MWYVRIVHKIPLDMVVTNQMHHLSGMYIRIGLLSNFDSNQANYVHYRYGSPGAPVPSSSVLGRIPKNNTTSPTPAATAWTLRQVCIEHCHVHICVVLATNIHSISRITAATGDRKLSIQSNQSITFAKWPNLHPIKWW